MARIAHGIYKRGKTFWFAKQVKGERFFVSLETKDEAEAVKRAATIKTSGALEVRETFDKEVVRFIATKKGMGKHTERSTKWFQDTLKQFSTHVQNRPCAKVTENDVESFYIDLRTRLAETTARSYMGAVRSFFAWSVKARLRFDNPTKEVKSAQISHPARTLFASKADRDFIISKAEDKDLRFILLCAFHAGMRFNEISEARREWFTLKGESGYVHIQRTDTFVSKNKKNRTVPLTKTFRTFLTETGFVNGSGFVLQPEKERKHKYRVNIRHPWDNHMKKCGFQRYSPHVARHTFASLLAQNGQSIYKIAEWIGDTLEVTRKHYAHLAPQDTSINLID
jgi:integrase